MRAPEVEPAACAVGRIDDGALWVGFAPTVDDGYALVVGGRGRVVSEAAEASDLIAMAIAYFEDGLADPPEELAATMGDIGAVVRHVAEHETDMERRRLLAEAVDAIDDGLPVDVVVSRLGRCLPGSEEASARLSRRAAELTAG